MKIALAQTRPIKGSIQANVESHLRFAETAARNGADFMLFPELSLTGYEPELAKDLATTMEEEALWPLQAASEKHHLIICAGLPTVQTTGVCISAISFYPNAQRRIFSKRFLHADEYPFFVSGNTQGSIIQEAAGLGLAICYELSVEEHLQQALAQGVKVYLASVAKSATGMKAAAQRLSGVAQKHGLSTAIVNCVGEYDNTLCSGGSAVWNNRGEAVASLGSDEEGLLVWDTVTNKTACASVVS